MSSCLRHTVELRPTRLVPATFWVRPGQPTEIAAELLAILGVEVAEAFELMAIVNTTHLQQPSTTLVRNARVDVVSPWDMGYYEVCPRLFLPVGRRLNPCVPPELSPAVGQVRWLTSSPLLLHTSPADFRPLSDWWTPISPPTRPLCPASNTSPFCLAMPHPEVSKQPDMPIVVRLPLPSRNSTPMSRPRLNRTLPRIVAAFSPLKSARPPESNSIDLRKLEARLVVESSTYTPTEQATQWALLATAYRAAGRTADAAICWLNAVWCHPSPPAEWPQSWQAYFASGRDTDRPVRAVWLTAITRHKQDGDGLALARCRDQLFARLALGSELDLDIPSFLRRDDRRPDPDAAKSWLTSIADPIRRWLATCSAGTKLVSAGLDSDRAATRCYAELIRAWGSATVGDRSALGRATTVVAELHSLRRPTSVVSAVHQNLGERFLSRVRSALTGQPDILAIPSTDTLAPFDRFVTDRLLSTCESLGAVIDSPFDTPPARMIAAANSARASHQTERLRELFDTLDLEMATLAAAPLCRAAYALHLDQELARLVTTLASLHLPVGGRRDLGLAVGRFLTGDDAAGTRTLDAARHKLLVTGVSDPRHRGELAIAYATAVGYAAPRMILGRLDELFRRLGPVFAGGACGRYFAHLPLRIVDAAVRAAVGEDFEPSPAIRRWLADEEWQTRRRIHRDLSIVLGATADLRDGPHDRR